MEDAERSRPGFSLVRGGPLYHFWRRFGFVRHDRYDALRIAASAIAVSWLPLVAIAVVERLARGSWPSIVAELSVHARLLLALPLLALAEPVADVLTRRVTARLVDDGIVDEHDPSLARALRFAERLRDSRLMELTLLVCALVGSQAALWGLGPWRGNSQAMAAAAEWSSSTRVWYGVVALPIVQLFTYRWLWRWLVWTILLVRISRLRLRLEPAHPDGAGGLGQLAQASLSFAPFACASSAVIAAAWATDILEGSAGLVGFVRPLLVFVVVVVSLAFGPLLAFTPQLMRARVRGAHDYGRFFAQYTQSFRRKWIDARTEEPCLDNPHIEPMANLGEIHRRVMWMRVVVFEPRSAMGFAILTLVPMLPLVLTEVPLDELLRMIAGVLLGGRIE